MSGPEQIDALAGDLDALVSRYCAEFELTTAAAIGVLEIKKHELISEALKRQEDDEDAD